MIKKKSNRETKSTTPTDKEANSEQKKEEAVRTKRSNDAGRDIHKEQ